MNRLSLASPFRLFADYGMLLVLLLLCLVLSVLTYSEQHPTGTAAARQLTPEILRQSGTDVRCSSPPARAETTPRSPTNSRKNSPRRRTVVEAVRGEPRDARQAFAPHRGLRRPTRRHCLHADNASWLVFADLPADFPKLSGARVVTPRSYWWPTFLKSDNLLNITNQIAVIAILAVGMTW